MDREGLVSNPCVLSLSKHGVFPDITELALRKSAVNALSNLSGMWEELKDYSVNLGFLANYVLSVDFCFFSSRKRRINKLPFSFSYSE
jgi:hypothetical protein